MQANDKIIAAVELLYGNSGLPMGICSAEMELLWSSDETVPPMHAQVLAQLSCSDDNEPLLPANGLFSVTERSKSFQCQVLPLTIENERYYLLQIQRQAVWHSISSKEMRALFLAHSTDLHLISSALSQAADLLEKLEGAESREGIAAARLIDDSMYSLLHQAVRCQELAWYESMNKYRLMQLPAVDVASVVLDTMRDIRYVMQDYVKVEMPEFPQEMYARVDIDRLRFALFNIFVMLQEGYPNRTLYRCEASIKQREITLILTAAAVENRRDHVPMLRRERHWQDSDSAASTRVLLERFCKTFRGSVEFERLSNATRCTLRLPTYTTETNRLEFSADRENVQHNRFSLPFLLLSPIAVFPKHMK